MAGDPFGSVGDLVAALERGRLVEVGVIHCVEHLPRVPVAADVAARAEEVGLIPPESVRRRGA